MTHKGKHNKCPTCANVLAKGGEWKFCPRCGYTTKPRAERFKKETVHKPVPKPFVSSIRERWGKWLVTRKLKGER